MNKNYVLISVIGKNPLIFIKRLIVNNIKYYDLKSINYKKIILKVSYHDYLIIIDKKSIYEINVIKYYGIIKYIYFIKNNLSFLISLLISVFVLIMLSNTCFNINVVHNDKKIRKLVLEELEENGIKKYKLIPNFNNRRKIIDKIIKENKNVIEWLEIQRKGSKLIVKLTERKINDKKENIPYRHAVAKKSGIIKKIVSQNGVIIKKINDYVSKGDIVVSGDIIKDETVKGQVAVNALIYAEVWYTAKVDYPLYYEEVKYLNEIKNNYIITFLNKSYSLKKNYATSYLENKKVIMKDNIFPFEFSMQKQRKTKVIKEKLKEEEAVKKAIKKAEEKIKSRLDKDEYIIDKKTLNFTSNGSKIIVEVFFKVYENITDYKDAEIIQIKTEE